MQQASATIRIASAMLTLGLVGLAGAILVANQVPAARAANPTSAKTEQDDWHLVPVPDLWKRPQASNLAPIGGYSWCRCLVKVPASWKGRKLELFVEPVDDARATYWNGRQVGASGTFPPRYRSGLADQGRFAIDSQSVRFDDYNVVAVRTYYEDGRTNFSVAAPVLLAGDEAIRMEGNWQYRPGDDAAWANGPSAPPVDGAAVFAKVDTVEDLDSYVKRRQGDHDPYPPAEAVKRFRVPVDLKVELALSEPEIRQPLFLNFDERGRLWVLQYLQYPNPAGLQVVSRDQHLRTVYDKVPPPPPHHFRGDDKITIHEDSDGDGAFDKHTTFVDGLSIATSFVRGRGGVWVLNPPYLLFYPDRNNDDVPDSDPEVHLEGFGLQDTHSVCNSLRWGPDGWLYAAQGSTVTAQVRRPGLDKEPLHSMGQLVWRYHPETRRYEIFGEGGGNTFGVEIDSSGRVFSGHNGGDTRGFHYVQGGYSQKSFGKHGSLSNPYAFGFFPAMKHHSVPRFTHNFIIYEGATLPEQYHGRLFGVEPLQGQIVQSEVSRDGSSFMTKDVSRPVTTDDQWFRPVDIKVGPDGAIYFCDLHEQRIDHSSHFAGRIDRSNGRIYRLTAKDAPTPAARTANARVNYAALSSRELVDRLAEPNTWHCQTILRVLADRKDTSIIPRLEELIDRNAGQLALDALWALNLSGGLIEDVATRLLDHTNQQVRIWSVRLMCDDHQVSDAFAAKLAELARREPYVDVRSQLACSARRLPAKQCLAVVGQLLRHSEDANDVHLPLLLWWAVEAKADADRDTVLEFLAEAAVWDLPLVKQHVTERIMRRYALSGTRKDLLTCAKLLALAPRPEHAAELMKGFELAFQGRSLTNLPNELVDVMAKVGGGSTALRMRRNDATAIAEALKLIPDDKADKTQRLQYLQVFGEVSQPKCVPVLLAVAKQSPDRDVRTAALTALQLYNEPSIPAQVVGFYKELQDDVAPVAATLLASRKQWAVDLLQAVDGGTVPAAAVPVSAVRKMLLHDDDRIRGLVEKHWGAVQGATTDQMRQQIEHLAEVIAASSGNPYKGKQLYSENCGKCHRLFEQGGEVGPDLTAYKRDNLERMLLNVVNPSAEIREGFENYVVVTQDGRVVNGFLADQDNRVVVLRGVDGQNQIIARDDIDDMHAIPRSVMPDGALDKLADQQVRDLFAYLRSAQPVP